jgi:hypothetical protein
MHVSDGLIRQWTSVVNDTLAAPPTLLPASIAAGESISQAVAVPKGMRLWALALPAEWTESEISYSISFDGRTFYEPTDGAGSPLVETPRAIGGTAFLVCSYALLRAAWVRVRSGSAASVVPQASDRTLQLLFLNHNVPTIF